jgi:predicted secreted hydrolase
MSGARFEMALHGLRSASRRRLLLALAGGLGADPADAAVAEAMADEKRDEVHRGRRLQFPLDHGAHLGSRTEWWYVTGWFGQAEAPSHGLQLTFFRHRTGLAAGLPGRLAPRQLLFAHAAITELDPRGGGRHRHAERIMRWNGEIAAPGELQAAGATTGDARVWIADWHLQRQGERWQASARAAAASPPWALRMTLRPTQPPLLQGEQGYSRKGPREDEASLYLSLPQLALQATLESDGRRVESSGRAWLDHEWSESLLAPEAVGWDWIGINLFDGRALTAFQIRRADGSALWAGGSLRASKAETAQNFAPENLRWTPERRWHSAATGADYPVAWRLLTPAGVLRVRALLDAQELDARRSTGTIYWEGLSELLDEGGRRLGLGYLEMTGYASRMRL